MKKKPKVFADFSVGDLVTPVSPSKAGYGYAYRVTRLIPPGEGGIDGRVLCGLTVFMPAELISYEKWRQRDVELMRKFWAAYHARDFDEMERIRFLLNQNWNWYRNRNRN